MKKKWSPVVFAYCVIVGRLRLSLLTYFSGARSAGEGEVCDGPALARKELPGEPDCEIR